jgi:O-antigen/teichoic acid export membrane protein
MHPRLVLARERLRLVLHVMRLRPFDTDTAEGRSLERYRRIVLSTVSSVFARGIATVASLITIPVMISFLGKPEYGFWVAVNALVPWLGMLDFGIGNGLVNPISEAHGREDREAARGYFSTAFFLLAAVALGLLVVLAVALPLAPWPRIFATPPSLAPSTVRTCVALACTFTALGLPLATATQVYAGYQKTYIATAFPAIGAVLSLGLLVAVVRGGGSIVAVFAAVGGGLLLGASASMLVLVLREMPWLRPSLRYVSRQALRRLLATSVPLYLFQFGSLLVNQTQQLVLVQRAGLSTVAEYDLLFKVYVTASLLVVLTTSSFGPSFREAYERGELGWMRRSFWHLMKLRMTMAALGAGVLLVAGDLALRLWLRRTDFQYGTGTWALIALLILAAVWAATFSDFLMSLDRIWPQIGVVVVQGLVTVTLTWLLAGRFGLFGAVVAYTLPAVALSAFFFPRIARPFLAAEAPAPGSPRGA